MDINVYFKGCWEATQVIVTETPSTRHVDPALEGKCLADWNNKLAMAKKEGKLLWDSEIYRFEKTLAASTHNLSLQFSTIPFSVRLGMNAYTDIVQKKGLSYAPQGLFTSVLLVTSDEYFVFIEKSDRYFTTKKYSWIGGMLSKTEKILNTGEDLFDEVQKEIFEESTIAAEHIADKVQLLSGYRTDNWNVCLLFRQAIQLTAAELQTLFELNGGDEAKNLLMIHPDELSNKLSLFEPKDQEKFAILDLI